MTTYTRVLSGALIWGAVHSASAQDFQEDIISLEPYIVTANRLSQPADEVTESATILSGEELDTQGVNTLQEALTRSPGVISLSTAGQRGQTASLFIRGTATDQSHIRVDGIRISDSNLLNGSFLSQQTFSSSDRLEILRGAQSSLYGSEAIGGVISLSSQRGSGPASFSLSAEAGSFSSEQYELSTQGESGDFAWNLTLQNESTDNNPASGDIQDFTRDGLSLRLDYDLTDRLTIGSTIRISESDLDSRLLQISDNAPSGIETGRFSNENSLITLFAELSVNDLWTSRLTAGLYEEDFDGRTSSVDTAGNFSGRTSSQIESSKLSLEWINTLEWSEKHTSVLGSIYEHTELDNRNSLFFPPAFGFPTFVSDSAIDLTDDLYGAFINHIWNPTENWTVSGGLRWEEFNRFDDVTTWRLSSSYEIPSSNTKFHASFGRAFRAPNFQELFGFGDEPGTLSLSPERSISQEYGISQKINEVSYISTTLFRNNIKNAILDPFFAAPTNLSGTTRTEGVEVDMHLQLSKTSDLSFQANYTHLIREFQGLPKDNATAQFVWTPSDTVTLGLGASHLGTRDFGGNDLPSVTLYRIFGQWDVNDQLTLNARVENLLDKDYELSSFNFDARRPGQGLGAYIGAKFNF